MKNNTIILETKVELLTNLLKEHLIESQNQENSLKRLDGYSFGSKEISKKFAEFIGKKKLEIATLVKEGKLPQQVGTFIQEILNGNLSFISKEQAEAEKLFFVKQGELLTVKNQAKKINSTLEQTKTELQQIKNDELKEKESRQIVIESALPKTEKPRPDKDPTTKIGRAAMDLMERKRKTREELQVPEKKRGRKKKL